ncbi:hypothetical protein KKH23_07700 [Patescibacteria group bacterium]|nr:hypothetical protein [Patescibacteria group bacterium]
MIEDISKENRTKLAVIANDITYIKKEVEDISEKLEDNYITRQEFDPVKKVVYGIIAIILTSVMAALVALVVLK